MFNIDFMDTELITGLSRAYESTNAATTGWLVDMATWVKNDLKQRVPVKTGQLKSSIRYSLTKGALGGGEAQFLSVFYGKYVDEGTNPFKMTAQIGKPMVFMKGSDKVFSMTCQNPGIKARDFTLDSFNAAEAEATRQMDAVEALVMKAVVG